MRPGQANVAYFRLQISTSVGSGTLTSLTLTNATTGTGDQTQRDSELGSLRLYIDDGDGNPDPTKDTLVPVTPTVVAAKIRFAGLNVPIQDGLFGATNYFHVIGNVPLLVRDGDALDLMIQAASDMTFQSGNTAGGTYPLDPVGNFPVDGMVAAQISVNPVPTGSILAGTQNLRVLELVLPANGYEADQLQDLRLLNEGTAS